MSRKGHQRSHLPVTQAPSPSATASVDELTRREQFDYMFRLFELYTNTQVQADTIYHNRTSIITLAEGLLFVAYQSLAQTVNPRLKVLGTAVAGFGTLLSILWLLFEQRNAVYFKGRGHVLSCLETELAEEAITQGVRFHKFWTAVPVWVKQNARVYERVSAPFVLRFCVPALFVITWAFLCALSPLIFAAPGTGTGVPKPGVSSSGTNTQTTSGSAAIVTTAPTSIPSAALPEPVVKRRSAPATQVQKRAITKVCK